VDPDTGVFSVTGVAIGVCVTLTVSGTADGEMFTGHYYCDSGSGPVTATKCLNGILDPGEDCQDGNAVDGDCCSSRCRFEPAGNACPSDGNVCISAVCDGAGTCTPHPNTAACDDGNGCTVGDICADGTCTSGPPASAQECSAIQACERTVAHTLSSCISHVGGRMKRCYLTTGGACPADDSGTVKSLARVAAKIGAKCPDAATVQAIGYGAEATPATVIARVQEACAGEVASIAARTFGGPQAAILAGADKSTRKCLSGASSSALRLITREANIRSACIAVSHVPGKTCDVAATSGKMTAIESSASLAVGAKCPDLELRTGLDASMYIDRAAAQSRCVSAAAHGSSGPLALDCGPRLQIAAPARDTWTQVVLDEALFGTRCGDGSPYAFWLRLPPAGSSAEKVVIDLAGGGYCAFDADCAAKQSTGLFRATDVYHPTRGILSTSAAENPFADWTMVYLPYCTQDLHLGGGVTQVFPSLTVHRYGALNVRAALRYVRDVLWRDLAAAQPEGYRPDRLTVLFSGTSSGGAGANYNYHYLLDDLRWVHTTAVPDSGFTLDNGQPFGALALAGVVQTAWGTRPYQPPYCLDPSCAITPVGQAAHSPRLKAVPEQQILNVANQVDATQAQSNLFATTVDWINALRTAYCANQGLPGIRNWLSAQSTPEHTIIEDPVRWSTVTAGGETVRAFLADAMANPDGVTDHVDEGTLVDDYPGVNPIPCP
jgi:cysteine-rich repeat protein